MIEFAVISDIHGNIFALEKVLKELEKTGINKIYNLGDSLYGPLEPHRTAELLKAYDLSHLMGNQDRYILESVYQDDGTTIAFCLNELTSDDIKWLKTSHLSEIIEDDMIFLHGSRYNDSEYLLEDINCGYTGLRDSLSLKKILQNIEQRIIFCGHSHFPRFISADDKVIINPGSVGLQAYSDNEPLMHIVRNGSPEARFSIVEIDDRNVSVTQKTVSYEHHKAAKTASRNGRDDWAEWLMSGSA